MNDSRIPETISQAISEGTHIIRAYREHLGYSIEDLAVACGLAAEEIEIIESGLRYNKGYRVRIARSLSLPAGIFDEEPSISVRNGNSPPSDHARDQTDNCHGS